MYSDGSFCCSNRTQFCLPARARFLRSVLYRSRRRCAHFQLDTERRGNHCTRRPCHMILLLKCLMYGSRTSNMRDIKFLHGTCFWSPAMLKQFRLHSFHFFFHLNVTCIYDFNSYFNGLRKVVFGMNTIFIPLHLASSWRGKKGSICIIFPD